MRLNGFRIKGKDIEEVYAVLMAAKANVAEAQKEEYHRLLSDEITLFVDRIATNAIQRPAGISLLELAVSQLNRKIQTSECGGAKTEYNFNTSLTMIPYKGNTYLLFAANNALLFEAFKATEGIEDFSVELDPSKANALTVEEQERVEVWKVLEKSDRNSSAIRFTLTSPLSPVNTDLLHFESANDRAIALARHTLTNRYLSMYACGKEIQNIDLMHFLDLAMLKVLSNEVADEMNQLVNQLVQILPEITEEIYNAK